MKKTCTLWLLSALALAVAWILPVAALAQDVPEPASLALHAAAEYRQQARYPGNSKLLPAGVEDPVRAKLRTHPTTRRGSGDEVTSLTVYQSKLSYEAGATVEIFAVPAGDEVLAVTGEVTSGSGARVATLHFFDDGVDADQRAGDGIFTASFTLEESLRPELAEVHMATVRASFNNGETRAGGGGYVLSNPWSELTGRYRDRVEDGNVVVSAEVEVTRTGRFHLMGTLHTMRGEPIGTAQTAQVLEVGKHWIDLSFYGLMFHDRKVIGPYRLGSLALRTTGGMPNALSDLVENAHVIPAIPLARLTSRPADEPGLLRAAEVLEAAVARGDD